MTDRALVEKKLAFIETCVADLRRLAVPANIDSDVKELRFVEHTLQVAIQAALDVAAHVVADDRLGEPATNHELFSLLVQAGRLDADLGHALRAAVGFRNILVHGYAAVDPAIVRDVLANHLDDLLSFVEAIRRQAGAS